MDRQEVPCWAPHHMLRGMSRTGTNLDGSPSINTSLPAANIPFQSNGDGNSIDQTLAVDTSSTISPRGSTGAPTPEPQGDQPVRRFHRKQSRPQKFVPDGAPLTQSASTPGFIPDVLIVPEGKVATVTRFDDSGKIMDRREVPYSMLRGISRAGTGLDGTYLLNTSLLTPNIPFQTSGDGTSIDQTLIDADISNHQTLLEAHVSIDQTLVVDTVCRPDATVLSQPPSTSAITSTPTPKRGRGTPPGTGGTQQPASSAGIGYTLHDITIAQGEDIYTKIITFSQQERKSICVLLANGVISTVTLRQPSTFGGTIIYEGNFEILYLSGSFVLDDSGESQVRTGGLSVALAYPDGRIIGGAVGGVLIAASPIQVLVGSFLYSNSKANKKAEGSVQSAETSDPQTECPAYGVPDLNLTPT